MNTKLFFRISTGLLTFLMLFSASMYVFANEIAVEAFTKLGFPIYIIYPLAVAKVLGLIAIWSNKSKRLTEWAYAGFAFDLILAVSAHLSVNDGEFMGALVGLIILGSSYFFRIKLQDEETKEATFSPSHQS